MYGELQSKKIVKIPNLTYSNANNIFSTVFKNIVSVRALIKMTVGYCSDYLTSSKCLLFVNNNVQEFSAPIRIMKARFYI